MQPMGVYMAMNLCALFVHDTLPLKPKQGLLSLDIPPDFSFLCGSRRIKFLHFTTALPRGVEVGTKPPFYWEHFFALWSISLGIKIRHHTFLLSLYPLSGRINPECDFVPQFTQIQFQYPELSDESENLSRKSREELLIFFILAAITVYDGIGQLLPHISPYISAVDTSSYVTRASSQN